jgi:phosphoglycerate dehydrogenase-like enzyme
VNKNTWKLVIHPAVEPQRLARIVAVDERLQVVNAADSHGALQAMPGADAFFGKLTPDLIAAADRLRWVQAPTASLEHFLFPELVAHPCQLTNMRGLYSDIVADQVIGYILCFARNLHTYIRTQHRAVWSPCGGEETRTSFATGPGVVSGIDLAHDQLCQQTLGIIGLGGIGTALARRATAFEMRLIAIDPRTAQTETPFEVRPPTELDWLLGQSDYVALCAPHTPETAQLIRRTQLQSMKSSARLINVGRGALVSLADLVAALEAKEIAGAALDVFETEPLPSDHALWKLDNVILTPHVAGFGPLIAARHLQVLLDNLRRFVAGQPLLNLVDKAAWY